MSVAFIGLVFYAVIAAVFFAVLYLVIRAGVRDGTLAADKRREDTARRVTEL